MARYTQHSDHVLLWRYLIAQGLVPAPLGYRKPFTPSFSNY